MSDYHDDTSQDHPAESTRVVQRRRRPPLSCTECRRRKLKCDRSLPCGQCIRSKTADSCVFVGSHPGEISGSSRRMSPPVSRMRLPGSPDEQPAGTAGGMFVFDSKMGPKSDSNRVSKRNNLTELNELRNRLRALEHALAKPGSMHTPPETSVCDIYSELGTSQNSVEGAGVDDRVRFLPDSSFRGKKAKTRYFGRSHYTTTVSFFQDIGTFMRRSHKKVKDKEYTDMKSFKCEMWSRESQEHQRAFREQAFKLDEMVPSRAVTDKLVQLYLDTFETTYRILHVPTFLKQYAEYWASPQNPDMGFIARLLAVIAAGSRFYMPSLDRDERNSYLKPAMKWIMAVQSYISCTFVSPDIDLKMIQTQCLLLVARLAVASDGDVAWASSGSLIRSAMTMGLHRDPTRFRKATTPFWSELRRRLWTTIVELDLKISLDRGVTPSVDLDECDCDAPSNWDDSELYESMESNPVPLSTATYTRNFYQTLLTRTLDLRYRIAKKINTLRFNLSYDETLRMSEELVRAMKNASALFDDNASEINPSDAARHRFAQSLHLFIMRKFLLALHRPFSLSVVRLPKCSYSRKVCLEASLEVLTQMEIPSPADAILYPHITQLGAGMFCDETFHAAITVCVELSLQAQEANQPGSSGMDGMGSSVLMSMIQSQQNVMLQAVERTLHDFGHRVGVGNGKGTKPYFFLSIILASVKSRIKGEDPLVNVEAASKRAVRVGRGIVGGLSYTEALANADRQSLQVSLFFPPLGDELLLTWDIKPPMASEGIIGTTPMSNSSNDFDLPSLLSTDFGEFMPLDLGGWFDTLDPTGQELWDNNLFNNLPQIQ
ncbi:hypothetical protein N7462_004212 [Penicillium macrosclerotiorum]|uniref:uncharacterized protein n=1 Tax=Penicillium macrosclerotiorum TaxID=303699 RepID=UPI0025470152|nr:uncharacterized protein N7462_004212 [Penicillium macrosclerotiorum]KAJ5689820.1 hypothetical protein N7462_004212 [Penicillium macrosclerotiorum]